jgi:hypothetical protein
MRYIPNSSIMDTVIMRDGAAQPTPRRLFGMFFCKHMVSELFTRIDHSAGPGSLADTFTGRVCMDCGKILYEREVH